MPFTLCERNKTASPFRLGAPSGLDDLVTLCCFHDQRRTVGPD